MRIRFSQDNFNKMDPTTDWNSCLIQVGLERDKDAFADLFRHFSPLLKAFLLKGGSVGAEHAEELVQETMIKVWQKAASFSPDQASAGTWIYTIARNTRIDWFRKHALRDAQPLRAEDLYEDQEAETPFSAITQMRTRNQINEQIQSLPTDQSEVLRLMYYQGLSGQQVADALKLPLGTVKSRIRLAMAKLKLGIVSNHRSETVNTGDFHD